MQQEDNLSEIVQLVGKESLSEDQKVSRVRLNRTVGKDSTEHMASHVILVSSPSILVTVAFICRPLDHSW